MFKSIKYLAAAWLLNRHGQTVDPRQTDDDAVMEAIRKRQVKHRAGSLDTDLHTIKDAFIATGVEHIQTNIESGTVITLQGQTVNRNLHIYFDRMNTYQTID